MKTMEMALRREIHKLEDIARRTSERLRTAPKGFLRISNRKTKTEYYYKGVEERNRNGRYIRKGESELAQRLAQRDYDVQVLETAQKRIKSIEGFLKNYEQTDLGEIYRKTNPYRQALIEAEVIPDEEYIRQWQAVEYEGKPFAEDGPEFITERGERVRSKSEKIIADKLYSLGIPYRYEYPLVLQGNIKIYPDFTILRMPEREEVYLEHFGMMDDSGYVNNVMIKLNTYQKNEIYIGVNLFITHETSRNPLNTKMLDKLMRKLFCVE